CSACRRLNAWLFAVAPIWTARWRLWDGRRLQMTVSIEMERYQPLCCKRFVSHLSFQSNRSNICEYGGFNKPDLPVSGHNHFSGRDRLVVECHVRCSLGIVGS